MEIKNNKSAAVDGIEFDGNSCIREEKKKTKIKKGRNFH